MFSCLEGGECSFRHLCCGCCHLKDRRFSTGDAFLCAAAASTWSHDAFVSQQSKNKNKKVWCLDADPGGFEKRVADWLGRGAHGHDGGLVGGNGRRGEKLFFEVQRWKQV